MDKWKKNLKPSPKSLEESIRLLARRYADRLKNAIALRLEEMKADDRSHFLIYQVLGVGDQEGQLVDEYQNKGRFLYKYAGSFLEEAAKLCFLEKFPESGSVRIPNTQGRLPKTFEIDCLVWSEPMQSRSSGEMQPLMVITLRRSIRAFEQSLMPDIFRYA
jgi:ApaLI-like restriction endonuclease